MSFEAKYKEYKNKFLTLKDKNDALEAALEDSREEIIQKDSQILQLQTSFDLKITERAEQIKKDVTASFNSKIENFKKENKKLIGSETKLIDITKELKKKIELLEEKVRDFEDKQILVGDLTEDMLLYEKRRSLKEVKVVLSDIFNGKCLTVRSI